MYQTADKYLNHIFEQKPGVMQKNMLAGMIDQVLNLKSKLNGFGKFLSSNTYNDIKTTTFLEEIKEPDFAYQYIPSNASDNLLINFLTNRVQEKYA